MFLYLQLITLMEKASWPSPNYDFCYINDCNYRIPD